MRKIVSVSNIHNEAINTEVNRCIDIATKKFNMVFKTPRILYEIRGRTAGCATYSKNEINFNSILLKENGFDFINNTVGHEVAHIISYMVYGNSGTGHGKYWKYIMRLFGLDSSRCHSYDITNAAVYHKEKHVYSCDNCGEKMIFGITRHNRQKKSESEGYSRYWHVPCNKANITYIKNAGRVSYKEALVC